jgi:ABC-type sugar transport system substrate-binding protein
LKTYLKLFVVLMLIALLPVNLFAAKKKTAKGKTQPTVGRIYLDLSHPYQQADAKHYEAYAKELGYQPLTIDGKANMDVMINAVGDLIAKKVDGIIVQPLDGSAIAGSVIEAQKAGIPIVVFFENVRGAKAPYVRINENDIAFKMGQIAGKKAKEIWPGKPINMGIIGQPEIQYVQEHRTDPFIAGVQDAVPGAKVAALLNGKGARDSSLIVAEDLLQSHPEVNIVYGINADSALGALAAFQAAGRGKAKNGIPLTEIVVSIDGSTPECQEIVNPNSALKLAMALSPKNNARTLMDTLVKTMKGQIDPKSDTMIDTYDTIINGWTDNIDAIQKFITEEYFAKVDLKASMKK